MDEYNIGKNVIKVAEDAEKEIKGVFERIDLVREYNQLKVMKAMQRNRVSDTLFGGTTGYGYDDRGREALDAVYADIFKAEDALVRHQIVSGTHAIALCLFGNLRPGDELLCITGKPYDTLEELIGMRGEGKGSLKDFGIAFKQVNLKNDGGLDYDAVRKAIAPKTKMVFIQRSRGYDWRASLRLEDIKKAAAFIKSVSESIIIMVDNCYGEFVEEVEPVEAGADIAAGSLIKNPGGGLAPTGGYIAGKSEYVGKAACRLTSPGIGKKVGATLGINRHFFQGIFMAPHVVAESLKGAVFCSAVLKMLGFETSPGAFEKRGDIIQAVRFGSPDTLIAFCKGIQAASPVDAHVTPEPWDMPGYGSQVIMAAGTFVQGASIELSADAPIKPPYTAYMQGGLVYEHAKLGVMTAVKLMAEKGMLRI